MQLTDRYQPAGQDVVAEEIDGEVVIVNLANGNYYSLTHSSTVIWSGIQDGVTVGEIESRLANRYSGSADAMKQGIADLLQALEEEQLIKLSSASDAGEQPSADAAPATPCEPLEPYQAPTFERFTDMGDLLLLDPVHEAEDEKGWPHPKSDELKSG